jgi:hypothetical protein
MSDHTILSTMGERLNDSASWPAWYQQLRVQCQLEGCWADTNPTLPELPLSHFKAPERPLMLADTATKDQWAMYDRKLTSKPPLWYRERPSAA